MSNVKQGRQRERWEGEVGVFETGGLGRPLGEGNIRSET